MRSFEKLLVCATEAGNPAVTIATRLAAASGASVTLASTLEAIPARLRSQLPRSWDVEDVVRAKKHEILKRAASRVRRSGVTPKTLLLEGAPVDAIIGEVKRGRYDLLVVSAPGTGLVDLTNTSAPRLVRDCPRPVLLVRTPRRRRRPRILVAAATAEFRAKKVDALTASLIESGLWLAEQVGGDVHVLHVYTPYPDGPLRRAGASPATLRKYHADGETADLNELERVIAPFRDRISRSAIHVRTGDPRKLISAFAAENRVSLLVIGTVARKGIAGRILGNTAEVLLGKMPCSMLVIRPD